MEVRDATDEDWAAIWPIIRAVCRAGETYTYPTDITERHGRSLWMTPPPGVTLVAVEDGEILGTARMGPNHMGRGAHVATASFMVAEAARGRGVGRRLGEEVIQRAQASGYRAMQFNAVVEANRGAVHLWKALGFDIVGVAPEAFDHPKAGLVGLYIMHRRL